MKFRKFIAGVCALSMLGTVASVTVNAEEIRNRENGREDIANTISSDDFSDVEEELDEEEPAEEEIDEEKTAEEEIDEEESAEEEIDEEEPAEEEKGWSCHGNKEWHFDDCDFDEDFEEFKDFMMNHDEWKMFDKPWFVIEVNENGEKAFRHEFEDMMDEFEDMMEDMPSFEDNKRPERHRFLGFDENGEKIFGENEQDKLVIVDEDGTVKDATAEIVDEEKELYKTIDIRKGRHVLVKHEDNDNYTELDNGDANADSSVDIRDVTIIAQEIVKLVEIPDYMVTADIDNNDEIDIKDLAQLKKYLIHAVDSL